MKKNIYKKIFYSFSLVIVIYTVLILVVVITKEIERQKVEKQTAAELFLEREGNTIDSKLEVSLNSIRWLANQPDVIRLLEGTDQHYELYSKVYDAITGNLFSGYQIDYNIGITNGGDREVISSNGYFTFSDYLQFIGVADHDTQIKDFFHSEDLNKLAIIDTSSQLLMMKKINYSEQSKPLYFLVNWEKENIFSTDYFSKNAYLTFITADSQHYPLNEQATELKVSELLPLATMGSQIQVIDKKRLTAFQRESASIPGLMYLYMLPKNQVGEIPFTTIFSVLPILAVSLIIGSALTIYLSKSSYKPYKRIINGIQNEAEPISDQNEIEYILHRIESLQNTNQGLSKFREEGMTELRELFFKNLIFGKYTGQESEHMLDILELSPLKKGGIIVIITLEGITQLETQLTKQELLKARQQVIEYMSKSDEEGQLFVQPINYECYSLIFEGKDQERILRVISTLRKRLSTDLDMSSHFVMSMPFHTIGEFPETFRDVYSLNASSLFRSEEIIVNRAINKKRAFVYTVEMEQRLIQLVKAKAFEEALVQITTVLEKNFTQINLDIYSLEDLKLALLNTLKRIFQHSSLSFNEFYNSNPVLFDRLTGTDPNELYQTYLKIFQLLVEKLAGSAEVEPQVIERIIHYIDDHFTTDIGLCEVADQFHLSESYVSRKIKELTGVSFKNYVNQLKVNEAKRLLADHERKVSEVAEAIGCKNVNTFIRIFKQYEGITPGKYQNSRD